MAEDHSISQTVEVPSKGAGHEGSSSGGIMDPSVSLVVLTWITFIVMTVILYKVAWKPILQALDLRENSIRKALEDAEKARAETAAAEENRKKMIQEAETQARKVLADARLAAEETGRAIETRAREEAKNLVNDAKKEIGAATEKARLELRKETAELAITMASRCIGKNMDSSANRDFVHRLMKEM
jgi:F-type H+-transporting ATPase subunit b